jgi:hypothetical protein
VHLLTPMKPESVEPNINTANGKGTGEIVVLFCARVSARVFLQTRAF